MADGRNADGSLDLEWPHGFEINGRQVFYVGQNPVNKSHQWVDHKGYSISPRNNRGEYAGVTPITPKPAPPPAREWVVSDEAVLVFATLCAAQSGKYVLAKVAPILVRDNTREAVEKLKRVRELLDGMMYLNERVVQKAIDGADAALASLEGK